MTRVEPGGELPSLLLAILCQSNTHQQQREPKTGALSKTGILCQKLTSWNKLPVNTAGTRIKGRVPNSRKKKSVFLDLEDVSHGDPRQSPPFFKTLHSSQSIVPREQCMALFGQGLELQNLVRGDAMEFSRWSVTLYSGIALVPMSRGTRLTTRF